ncbi:MAG: LysM peptidoglycan-binding domain-containing protein [bacterium]|nr:LysM peptidoglycan-binding domain-containing protein [bacterium]
MKKQIITAILTTAMTLTLMLTMSLPVRAETNTQYAVWIGDVQVTSDNKDDVLSDGKVSYDPAANTLTLNGVNFTSTTDKAIEVPDGTTITLVGDNTITGANVIKGNGECAGACGIYCNGSLTINGSGLLNVSAGNAEAGNSASSYGISTGYNNLEICGTANVTARGGTVEGHNIGSVGVRGNVILNGGSLTTTGKSTDPSDGESAGIKGHATVNAGTLKATGDDYGITENATVVGGGTLTALGRDNRAIYGTFTYPVGDDIKTNTSAEPGTGEYVPADKDTYKWITVRKPIVITESGDDNVSAEGEKDTTETKTNQPSGDKTQVNTEALIWEYSAGANHTQVAKAKQGAACQLAFRQATPPAFTEAFTFNMLTDSKTSTDAKSGSFDLTIPPEYRKSGRIYIIMGIDKAGEVHYFPDIDTNASTITVNLAGFEGYAFSLIYSDVPGASLSGAANLLNTSALAVQGQNKTKLTGTFGSDDKGSYYIVQNGDTLSKIAAGLGKSVKSLTTKNNLKNPDELRIGQKIYQ